MHNLVDRITTLTVSLRHLTVSDRKITDPFSIPVLAMRFMSLGGILDAYFSLRPSSLPVVVVFLA